MFIDPNQKHLKNGAQAVVFKWIAGVLITLLMGIHLYVLNNLSNKIDHLDTKLDNKIHEVKNDLVKYVDQIDKIRHGDKTE